MTPLLSMRKDDGIVSGLYERAAAFSPSQARRNLAPYVSPKPRILSLSSASSSLMPTILSPSAPYLSCKSCSLGNDFLHGSQNVHQKSTRTTLPRRLLRLTLPLPLATVGTSKS